jgi:membrane protein required for colicin V production
MNTLDIIVVAVIALSGLFAFVRGFVRETLSIAAWVGAGIVTAYSFHLFQPTMRHLISAAWLADLLTGIVIFVVCLVLFSIVVGMISAQVRAIGLGTLDRALGLAFGVVRGGVLLCLAYLMMSHFLPADSWPPWIVEASSTPLLAKGAAGLQQLIPRQVIDRGTSAAVAAGQKIGAATGQTAQTIGSPFDALREPPKPKPAATPAQPGYAPEQEREMNRAIQSIPQ